MAKPSYSSTSLTFIKSKFASNPSGHSLNRNYLESYFTGILTLDPWLGINNASVMNAILYSFPVREICQRRKIFKENSHNLRIPSIAGVCSALQINSFAKWNKSNCQNYNSNKFSNNKVIIMLSLKYLQFNLGFFVDYTFYAVVNKYNTTIAIRMGRVSEDCSKTCPSLFNHLSSYDSISDFFNDYINHYIYFRQLNELLFKGVHLRQFPIISSFVLSYYLIGIFSKKYQNLTKSVDVVLIRHNDNTGSSSINNLAFIIQ
ncbi:hypothetical protein H8356DRAFT_1332896 [Neocallimastix lanati (nom. inval.)]|nr:hypothetical protein H8356DRAFT_1332896 [Neocallimastix sp. JGI-2020a]